jgi:molybdate transport system substrate-binding protein
MNMERRHLLRAVPVLPLVAIGRPAGAATTDLILNCDTTLGPAMTIAAARFFRKANVRVRVFPTGPGLILPQLAREVQNDLVCTAKSACGAAIRTNLIAPDAPRGAWRNRLVIAGRQGSGPDALKGRIAVSDATPASDMDGPAIVQALALGQSAILGVIDTDEVAFLLREATADAGLLHMTDIKANPELQVLHVVPDDAAPAITYAIAVTKLARRPDPQAFVEFLMTPEAAVVLQAQGLEVAA